MAQDGPRWFPDGSPDVPGALMISWRARGATKWRHGGRGGHGGHAGRVRCAPYGRPTSRVIIPRWRGEWGEHYARQDTQCNLGNTILAMQSRQCNVGNAI
eukprot:5118798-Karenia_brevis.AAC.1